MVDRLLYRQIHPSFVQGDIVTSQAFKPINDKPLSVSDGNMVTPKQAWERYTRLNLRSAGVMAVTEAECTSQDLKVIPEPTEYKEHMVIDFNDLPKKTIKEAVKSLTADANKRGWCYYSTIDGPTARLN